MSIRGAGAGMAVAAAMLGLAAGPAWGHASHGAIAPGAPGATRAVAAVASLPAGAGLAWLAALVVACTAIVVAARPCRRLCLLLALVLAGFAFESGRHAAHHIGQAPCPLAATVAQLAGAVDGAPVFDLAPARAWAPVPSRAVSFVPFRVLAPDAGRAPPSSVTG